MNRKPFLCDEDALRSALDAEPSSLEFTDVMDHVEQCRSCQRRLDELAALPSEWMKVGDALSDEDFTASASAEGTPGDDGLTGDTLPWRRPFRRLERANGWTETMAKQLLSPPSHPEMLGRLGRYEVERLIGAGGMGVVFKAFDSELNRPVAVKVLTPLLMDNGAARRRFSREARAAAAIVHEHVVPIYNVETERDVPFLVMQFVAGDSLQARIDRSGPLQICEVLRIGRQIASGLAAAHQQGLVHRDIKPSNILLDQGVERAMITDFGLALAVDDASLTRSGFHPGTPQFMSPEQAVGEPVDARSDLFSLGSVLYTMCTGRPPFRADSTVGVLRRIVDDEPRRIREVNAAVPPWLCLLISKLMSKRPADRIQTAAEAADLLERCLAHVQQPESCTLPSELRPAPANEGRESHTLSFRQKARRRMTKIFVSLALLAGMITTAMMWQQAAEEKSLAALQGEWQLVEREQDGKPWPQDQLYNERLVVDGTRFSRPQTAPNGTEIAGESGRLKIVEEEGENAIDFRLWKGTVRGRHKVTGDTLRVCVTRAGGPRPDAFATKAGDERVLYTYRRKTNTPPDEGAASVDAIEVQANNATEAERRWTETWLKKIPQELSGAITADAAQNWLRDRGFRNVVGDRISVDVMRRIHPDADEKRLQRDGVERYVYGILPADFAGAARPDGRSPAIAVYCLFSGAGKLTALHVDPCQLGSKESNSLDEQGAAWRIFTPATRPVMSDNAPVLACLGPAESTQLGQTVRVADLAQGLDPSVVRLHVWDWSKSSQSRVWLVQRSELGVLSPDGRIMLTQEGEAIDLLNKETRQYSGFRVSQGRRITALHVSPSRTYVAATIHERSELATIPTDPPVLDARHFWSLRLLRLDAAQHTGTRIGEYPVDARAGVVFGPDESFVVHATDLGQVVRRALSTGAELRSYEMAFGTQGAVCLAVSSDGRMTAAAGYLGEAYVWNTESGEVAMRYQPRPTSDARDSLVRVAGMRFSPDGSKLALLAGNRLKVLDAATGAVLRELGDEDGPKYVHGQWSPDGKTLNLVTSSERWEGQAAGDSRERLPSVYEWSWETGLPERKQFP
ncbi:MAG: protein kinase [Pirellulales bacterium]